MLQLTGNHPEYIKLSIQLVEWNRNRQDREVRIFSLGITTENKRKRYTTRKQSVVALRESHEEKEEGAAVKDAERAIKKVDGKPQGGYCHKSQAMKKVIKGIRLDRKVKEDTEIPVLVRKRSFETLVN